MSFSRYFRKGIAALCLLPAWLPAQTAWGDLRTLLRRTAKTLSATPATPNLEDWRSRKAQLRRQILTAAGLEPMLPKTPLSPKRFGAVDKGALRVEKVLLETLPGYYLAGNLYLPRQTNRAPAVLVPHGHWKHGRVHDAEDYSVPALCANLAAQGYVAFTWDMVGYNDTRQTSHYFGKTKEEQLWGFSPLGLQLWNSIRALDFVTSLKEVDSRRIGLTGASGGATQAILLAAVDPRIRVSVPVCMVSASFQGDCDCEYAPGLRVGTNNVEIAAMMSPRPMLLISATGDWTKNTPERELPAIQSFYKLYNRADRVSCVRIRSGHNYNRQSREAAYRFLWEKLRPDIPASRAVEGVQVKFSPDELLLGELPAELAALPQEGVFNYWRETARERADALPQAEAERLLAGTLGVSWPKQVRLVKAKGGTVLQTERRNESVPAVWKPTGSDVAGLVVHPRGSLSARHSATAHALESRDDAMLYLDLYQTGTALVHASACRKDCLTYQRSDAANRVSDILTGLAFLAAQKPQRIVLSCSGSAESLCLLAAALTPESVPLELERASGEALGIEEDTKPPFIPGLLHAGGLAQVLHLVESKHAVHTLSTE